MEFKIELENNESQQTSVLSFTPSIKSGFNSYYVDKLKHLKTATENFKSKDVTKNAKPYKIISPLSVLQDSDLNDHYKFGTKQDFYIIYEILKVYNLKGSVYSEDKKIKTIVDKINIKNIDYSSSLSNADIILNNSKVDFYKNFYNQEVKQIKVLHDTYEDCQKLKTGGDCIIKIYNVFLNNTVNEIVKFCQLFNKVFIYKPETVDNYKTDKYLICLGKKNKDQKDNDKTIKDLNVINTTFINEQTKTINEVINYINKRNYHGSDYNKYKEIQQQKQKEFIKKIN